MTEPQLLPCPFCGTEPRRNIHRTESLWSHDAVDWLTIECDECGAQSVSSEVHEDVIAAWQARASAATQAEPVLPPELSPKMMTALFHGLGISGTECVMRYRAMLAAAPVVPPVALPALTDALRRVKYEATSLADAQVIALEALAASAAPAPEQMQPNAGAGAEQDHLAGNRTEAPCGDEAVERDAVRYRHLRSQGSSLESRQIDKGIHNGPSCYHTVGGVRELKWGEELDAAIDAALSAVPPTVKEPK